MPCHVDPPSEGEVRQSIANGREKARTWDMEFLKRHLQRWGFVASRADKAVKAYRAYIGERIIDPKTSMPEGDVDVALHAHILHTENWRNFVNACFGGSWWHGSFKHRPVLSGKSGVNFWVKVSQVDRVAAYSLWKKAMPSATMSGMLAWDYRYLQAYLVESGIAANKDKAQEDIFRFLEYIEPHHRAGRITCFQTGGATFALAVPRSKRMRAVLEAALIHTAETNCGINVGMVNYVPR